MISPSSSRPKTGASPSLPGNCRILFGHQSVGMDLLQGIRSLDMSASISDLETTGIGEKDYGIFHLRLGKNGDPYSKIDDFADYVLSRKARWDVAVMKFCYVDVNQHTDVDRLFEHYRKMVENLTRDFPELHMVHVTVPLRTIRLGLRSRMRLMAGRDVDILEDNLRRDHYNAQLRATFSDRTRLLDLAQIEATQPDGNMCTWPYRSRPVPGLYPGFTDDGGHLNDAGAEAVARKFMALIDDVWT